MSRFSVAAPNLIPLISCAKLVMSTVTYHPNSEQLVMDFFLLSLSLSVLFLCLVFVSVDGTAQSQATNRARTSRVSE